MATTEHAKNRRTIILYEDDNATNTAHCINEAERLFHGEAA